MSKCSKFQSRITYMYLEDTKHGHSWNAYHVPSRMPSILTSAVHRQRQKTQDLNQTTSLFGSKAPDGSHPTLGKSKGHLNGL